MTRHTANTITSNALDQLYDQLDRLTAALTRVQDLAEEYPAGIDTALIHEALDEPTAGPTATQATHGQT